MMTVTSFFDQKNFKTDPISKFLMFEDFSLKKGIAQTRIAKVVRTNVKLRDSWLDFTPEEEKIAIDVKFTK
jgi:hypothetical protein